MSTLREQMESLTRSVTRSTHERHASVADSKVSTDRLLEAFRIERSLAAATLASILADTRRRREDNVTTIRASASALRRDLRRAGANRRRTQRNELRASTHAVSTTVSALCAAFALQGCERRKAHLHMTKTQRAGLAKASRELSRDVADLTGEFATARLLMAQGLTERLQDSMQTMRLGVAGLRGGFMGQPAERPKTRRRG